MAFSQARNAQTNNIDKPKYCAAQQMMYRIFRGPLDGCVCVGVCVWVWFPVKCLEAVEADIFVN